MAYYILSWSTKEFEWVIVWSKSDEEDALMKAVGKVVGLTGDSMVWHLYGTPFSNIVGPWYTDSMLLMTNYH